MSKETVEHFQGGECAQMIVSAPVAALAYAQSESDVLREPRRLVVVLSCAFWQAMRGADQTEPRSHVDVHACGSTEHPAERLLTYLREQLQRPAVAYLRPPVRIAGGFDTRIYAFQLAHVPPDFSGRLIVRIFRETDGGQRATVEGALQNALADAGYLVPRVVEVCTDATVLGGAFILMHCVEGQTLLEAMMRPSMLWRAPRLLASAHAHLHALDPLPILRAAEAAGVPSALASTDAMLVRLQARTQGVGWKDCCLAACGSRRIARLPSDARASCTGTSIPATSLWPTGPSRVSSTGRTPGWVSPPLTWLRRGWC